MNLLEKSSSRQIFQRVKDDSSSLIVLRDKASSYSQCTDNLSRVSVAFPFDRELFESKVYEKALRGSLKEALRRRQEGARSITANSVFGMTRAELKMEAEKFHTIDHAIKEENSILGREERIILLGEESERKAFKKQMIMLSNDVSTEECSQCRDTVLTDVVFGVVWPVIYHLREARIKLDQEIMNHAKLAWQELGLSQDSIPKISPRAANSIKCLWDSPAFSSFFFEGIDSGSLHLSDYAD